MLSKGVNILLGQPVICNFSDCDIFPKSVLHVDNLWSMETNEVPKERWENFTNVCVNYVTIQWSCYYTMTTPFFAEIAKNGRAMGRKPYVRLSWNFKFARALPVQITICTIFLKKLKGSSNHWVNNPVQI